MLMYFCTTCGVVVEKTCDHKHVLCLNESLGRGITFGYMFYDLERIGVIIHKVRE